jgi:hypothetical protein
VSKHKGQGITPPEGPLSFWLLRPIEPVQQPPWPDPLVNYAYGFVVRAGSEDEARTVASMEHLDEGAKAWLSPEHSTCEQISATDAPGIIMGDYHRQQ